MSFNGKSKSAEKKDEAPEALKPTTSEAIQMGVTMDPVILLMGMALLLMAAAILVQAARS